MFISTLLLIPWIIFGFRHPDQHFLGLTQTKKTLLTLLIIEVAFFTLLILLLDPPNPKVAGQGSFAWMYAFVYEKGIFPLFMIAESINGNLGDRIDSHYPVFYLPTAIVMDYILLFLISPNTIRWKLKPKITSRT